MLPSALLKPGHTLHISRPFKPTWAATVPRSARPAPEGFVFLGQNVRKCGNKLLIKPAKKSVKSLLDRIRKIIKGSAAATQKVLIQRLNPVIRGWAKYHRHIVAKATFSSVH